jgi:hypothetical protein
VRSAILGEFPEYVSICQALVEELQIINAMAVAMGRPKLFRNDYAQSEHAREFVSLRPTSREFERTAP